MVKRLIQAVLMLLVVSTVVTGVALPASAVTGAPPPTIEIGTDGSGSGSTGKPAPLGCASSCPKINVPPVEPPHGWAFRYDTSLYDWAGAGAPGKCFDKPDGRHAITITYRSVEAIGSVPLAERATNTGTGVYAPIYICNYHPVAVVGSRSIVCPVGITGDIKGPAGNPRVRSSVVSTINQLSPWAAAGRTGTDCSGTFAASLGSAVTEEGYYTATIDYRSTNCTVRTFSGTQPDEIQRCAPERSSRKTVSITVSCTLPGGWADRYVPGVAFGVDACRGITWSCVSAPLTYDTSAYMNNRVQVLADGVHRRVHWDPLAVNGVRGVGSPKTYLSVDPGSTPYRTGLGANDPNQPMEIARRQGGASVGLNTMLTGDQTDVFVGWQEASVGGTPSVLNRKVTFTGLFPQPKLVIPAIDAASGAIIGGYTTTDYVTATGSCPSQPLYADVHRGRNVN